MFSKTIVSVLLLAFAVQTSHSKSLRSHRISNGVSTSIEKYPSMVKLSGGCGGSLLTPTCVLTAAHCSDYAESVTAGITYYSEEGPSSWTKEFISHENYNSQSADLDVAIIVLESPLEGENVQPVKLDLNRAPEEGDVITVIGWGETTISEIDFDDNRSLQEVDFPVTYCPKNYSLNSLTYHSPTENMFCAGREDKKQSCNGDSGGPAYIDGKQVGIVSWGIRCSYSANDNDRYAAFVQLSSPNVASFIENTVAQYCNPSV